MATSPKTKWERQLTPYRIMGDLNWADLTGRGDWRLIAATSDDGRLYCLKGDGSDSWVFDPWDERFASSPCLCQPADGDPGKLIIIGTRYDRIFALDQDGEVEWEGKYPVCSIYGGPSVAGPPGSQLILHGGGTGRLYGLGTDGDLRWCRTVGGPIYGVPAAGDVNGDGRTEIFFGSTDSYLYSLSDDGSFRWRYKTREVGDCITSSPILTDVDADGRVEVICGSWDHHVYCFDADSGKMNWETELPGRIKNGLSIADLNGDGRFEILVGDVSGIACLSHRGESLWEFRPADGEMIVSVPPVIGDVTGDGAPNVVFGTQTGSLYALDPKGQLIWHVPLGEEEIAASPIIADVDGDGLMEVVFGTSDGRIVCLETPSRTESFWPMARRNPSLNPGLVPPGGINVDGQLVTVGSPVSGPALEGLVVDAEGEIVGEAGFKLWWDIEEEYPTLSDASPLRLYIESADVDNPVRGQLRLSFTSGGNRIEELVEGIHPSAGSAVVEVHLGGLMGAGEGLKIDVELCRDGETITGPGVRVRSIDGRALLHRVEGLRGRMAELDLEPRGPAEDLTRDLMLKCLEYAEADAGGRHPGRAEAMISQIEDQVEKEGYAWEEPSRESSGRVTVDDDGLVHVDGRPFFQLGLYLVGEAEDIGELARLGFNTIFSVGNEDFMRALEETGMMAIGPGAGDNMTDYLSLSGVRRRTEELYSHPSILAWYVVDEPSLRRVPVEVIRREADLIKMIDPVHPTLICDGYPFRGLQYQDLVDIASPCWYPVWKQISVTTSGKCIDEIAHVVPKNEAIWYVVQAWTWRNVRFPTPQEERVMTYLAIIHGARGISWFGYKHPNKETLRAAGDDAPELWEEIVRMVREIGELEHLLMVPRMPPRVSKEGITRVDWCPFEKDGEVLIIACNPTKMKTRRPFEVGELDGNVSVLWEDRSIEVSQGSFEDEMPPMSVRFYLGRRPRELQ